MGDIVHHAHCTKGAVRDQCECDGCEVVCVERVFQGMGLRWTNDWDTASVYLEVCVNPKVGYSRRVGFSPGAEAGNVGRRAVTWQRHTWPSVRWPRVCSIKPSFTFRR